MKVVPHVGASSPSFLSLTSEAHASVPSSSSSSMGPQAQLIFVLVLVVVTFDVVVGIAVLLFVLVTTIEGRRGAEAVRCAWQGREGDTEVDEEPQEVEFGGKVGRTLPKIDRNSF
jgi:hypothetical protein